MELKEFVIIDEPPTATSLLTGVIRFDLLFQTVDHSARVSMKNAASCEKYCELQTHRTLIFRTDIPALDLMFSASSVRGSYTYHGATC
jgi:hypothetical protein